MKFGIGSRLYVPYGLAFDFKTNCRVCRVTWNALELEYVLTAFDLHCESSNRPTRIVN